MSRYAVPKITGGFEVVAYGKSHYAGFPETDQGVNIHYRFRNELGQIVDKPLPMSPAGYFIPIGELLELQESEISCLRKGWTQAQVKGWVKGFDQWHAKEKAEKVVSFDQRAPKYAHG